jgi:hypothetical protein
MEARVFRLATMMMAMHLATAIPAMGAEYRTKNFIVNAPTGEFAERVGKAAEYYRVKLAVAWLGKPLPGNWSSPCPITVRVGQLGAGGATSFQFDRGEVFGWRMRIQGSEERILDSVLPHEISHMIFASHFRRPLPRWADEGAATLIEHESERRRQQLLLNEVMNDGTKFPLRQLLAMKEYPQDHRRVLTLYAQGYSLADYLIQKQGRRTFLKFLDDAHNKDWDSAIRTHYKMNNTASLESKWNNWIMAGSPRLNVPQGEMLADNSDGKPAPAVVRGQAPERSADNANDSPRANSSLGTPELGSPVELAAARNEADDEAPLFGARNEEPRDHAAPRDNEVVADLDSTRPGSNSSLQEFQIRGRRAVLLTGWEPSPVSTRKSSKPGELTTRGAAEIERPPFAAESAAPLERPPFVEDSHFAMSN